MFSTPAIRRWSQLRSGKSRNYRKKDFARPVPIKAEQNGRSTDYRTVFQRDYARILHSLSLRNLSGRTQLFPLDEDLGQRSRLTHSLEVSQIAQGIAEKLSTEHHMLRGDAIDLDLVQAAGLAHDIGHPPFGHEGERALNRCMKGMGGFESNAQALRIVNKLEHKYCDQEGPEPDNACPGSHFPGLNLTFRSQAALLKYDRPLRRDGGDGIRLVKGYYEDDADIVQEIKRHVARGATNAPFKSIECQIMDIADDIAYSTYDIEDSFRMGHLSPEDCVREPDDFLARVADAVAQAVGARMDAGDVKVRLEEVYNRHFVVQRQRPPKRNVDVVRLAHLDSERIRLSEFHRSRFTSEMIKRALSGIKIVSFQRKCPALSRIELKHDTLVTIETLKAYVFHKVVAHPEVRKAEERAGTAIERIFECLASRNGLDLMPDSHLRVIENAADEPARYRAICDYIAGLTDRGALALERQVKYLNRSNWKLSLPLEHT